MLKFIWPIILNIGFAALLSLINPIFGVLWFVFIGFILFVEITSNKK